MLVLCTNQGKEKPCTITKEKAVKQDCQLFSKFEFSTRISHTRQHSYEVGLWFASLDRAVLLNGDENKKKAVGVS